ncbi:MAG: hypothetical protein Rpha_2035 [Candidatus Ruthia sp. Apha_13_S6]|nr:hypothetical protein [Candidatus Ruthia sp. Apha_13_S6]
MAIDELLKAYLRTTSVKMVNKSSPMFRFSNHFVYLLTIVNYCV